MLSELLCADDFVQMSDITKGLSENGRRLFRAKVLKLTMVMVSSDITKDGMSKGKNNSSWVCSLRRKNNSVLCEQCGKCGKMCQSEG